MPFLCIQAAAIFGLGLLALGVLGEAEAERGVEVDRRLHVAHEQVEVVDALRLAAGVEAVVLQDALALLHLEVELERVALGVGGVQRAALERHLDELGGQLPLLEERVGAVEVLLAADLEAQPLRDGLGPALQHERVVIALLHAAEIDRVLAGILDLQADSALVEGAAGLEIARGQHRVAAAHDVERRVEDVCRQRAWLFPLGEGVRVSGSASGRGEWILPFGSPVA